VQARVEHHGLGDRISFVGEHDAAALDRLYASASAFVLASHYEGYGMALAEALAHGLPVVSTTGGAIPWTVPAEAGLLVPPGDASAFAAALRTLLQDEDSYRRLADGARHHADRLPDWDQAVDRFGAAVLELTGATGTDSAS
jgi:glycosyltransferase involved in cell wall biosynthesis